MKILQKLDKNFEYIVLALMLSTMCLLSFANVISRYVFNQALTWSDEVCCYLLAISAFFCLPCAIRNNSTLKVDTFTNIFPIRIRKILDIVCNLIMISILGFLFYGTLNLVDKATLIHQASPALGIPVAFLYKIMAFDIALGVFRYLQKIYWQFTKEEQKGE